MRTAALKRGLERTSPSAARAGRKRPNRRVRGSRSLACLGMQQSKAACFDREGVVMNRISVVTAVVLALSLIQLSGCAATSASTGGRSPSYAKGFDDGCQ